MKVIAKAPFWLDLTLSATDDCMVGIWIADAKKQHTLYANRVYGSKTKPFKGTAKLSFSFPVIPKNGVDITVRKIWGKGKVRTIKTEVRPLVVQKLNYNEATLDFLAFATEFAHQAGTLPVGAYASDNDAHVIRYIDGIKDHKTGAPIHTAARVNHGDGMKEIHRGIFRQMTVGNRMFVLVHEHTHFALNTVDEEQCDYQAAKICLEMGYAPIELFYASANLFVGNGNSNPQLRKAQEERVAALKSFIESYAKQLGVWQSN
jgi:hypothetical protein